MDTQVSFKIDSIYLEGHLFSSLFVVSFKIDLHLSWGTPQKETKRGVLQDSIRAWYQLQHRARNEETQNFHYRDWYSRFSRRHHLLSNYHPQKNMLKEYMSMKNWNTIAQCSYLELNWQEQFQLIKPFGIGGDHSFPEQKRKRSPTFCPPPSLSLKLNPKNALDHHHHPTPHNRVKKNKMWNLN